MKHYTVRFQGGLSWSANWPDPVPPLTLLDLPTRLSVPLIGHPLDKSTATKPTGAKVSKGDLLTTTDYQSGPAVLAPTSGRVVGTSQVLLTNGQRCSAIDIECDFEDRIAETEQHDPMHAQESQEMIESLANVGKNDLPEWIERLRRGGVFADRRSSPDLLGQLRGALDKSVDTVVCSLLDSDPPLRLSATLATRSPSALIDGIGLLTRIVGAVRTIIVVEAGGPSRWWGALERTARKERIIMVETPHRYPQNDPTLLLYNLFDRKLRPERLPVEKGVVVVDGAAAIAVGRYAAREQPMFQTPIAVRDLMAHQSHYLVAPIGMPLRQVMQQAGINVRSALVRSGDLLREYQVPLEAVTSGAELNLHVMHEPMHVLSDPCIRCGWCAESCPTRAHPAGLLEAAQTKDMALAEHYGLEACIDCGVCTHVCPSRLPLLEGIRTLSRKTDEAKNGAT